MHTRASRGRGPVARNSSADAFESQHTPNVSSEPHHDQSPYATPVRAPEPMQSKVLM